MEAPAATEQLGVWTNDCDWFVASDRGHLNQVHKEFYGYTVDEGDDPEAWYRMGEDDQLCLNCDDDFGPPADECAIFEQVPEEERQQSEWTTRRTATAEAWAAHVPAGFIGSLYW